MQTFLSSSDFAECARVLDSKRLGNQFYREGLTLLRGGWPNHPAARMWKGFPYALCCYLLACARELRLRGRQYPQHEAEVRRRLRPLRNRWMPPWLGDEALHASHRGNLLRKDPEWYGQFGWTELPCEGYVWPM